MPESRQPSDCVPQQESRPAAAQQVDAAGQAEQPFVALASAAGRSGCALNAMVHNEAIVVVIMDGLLYVMLGMLMSNGLSVPAIQSSICRFLIGSH